VQRNRRLAHSLEEEVFKSQAEDEVDVGGGPGADTEAEDKEAQDKEAQDRECLSLTNGSVSLLPITASVSVIKTNRKEEDAQTLDADQGGGPPSCRPATRSTTVLVGGGMCLCVCVCSFLLSCVCPYSCHKCLFMSRLTPNKE
jgi:hypothetical protein